jgi:hypothetical protein
LYLHTHQHSPFNHVHNTDLQEPVETCFKPSASASQAGISSRDCIMCHDVRGRAK